GSPSPPATSATAERRRTMNTFARWCHFGSDVDDHPVIASPHGVRASALRALTRPEARGHLADFMATVKEVTSRTPAGLIVGTGGSSSPMLVGSCESLSASP